MSANRKADGSQADRVRLRRRPSLIEILALVALVGVGAVFVRVVGDLTDRRMETLKAEAVAVLEATLDRRVSYQSLSPSVFGFLALRELTVYSMHDPEAVLLRVGRVKIHYNLLRFLTTRSSVRALSGIQIANSTFDVDHARDRELIELVQQLGGRGRRPPELGPDMLPLEISGANLVVRYRFEDWRFAVSNLFFTLQPDSDSYRVTVRGSVQAERLPGPDGSTGFGRISSRLRLTGRIAPDLTWTDLGVRIYELASPTLELKRQTFRVSFEAGSVRVRKIQDRSPLDLQLTFDTAAGELTAQFVAEGLKPGSLLSFSGALKRRSRLLEATVSANGTLTLGLRKGTTAYAADLKVSAPPGILPLPVTVAGRISGDDRVLYLRPLTVDSERGRVEFRGNVLLASLLPSGLLQFTDFQPVAGKSLSATLQVDRGGKAVTLQGDSVRFADTSFNRLELTVTPSREGSELGFLLAAGVDSPEPGLTRQPRLPGEVRLEGRLMWSGQPRLEVAGSASGIRLSTLYRFGLPRSRQIQAVDRNLADYLLSLEAVARTDFRQFDVSSESVEIAQVSAPDNVVRFAVDADNHSVSVTGLTARWSGYEIAGEAGLALQQEAGAELRTLLWFEGTPYEVTARYEPPGRVALRGSYGLQGSLELSGWGNPVFSPNQAVPLRGRPFRLRSRELPIPLRRGTVLVSLDVEGLVGLDGAVYALSPGTVVRNLPGAPIPDLDLGGSLELAFLLRDKQLDLSRITYQDRVSGVSGFGSATIEHLFPVTTSGTIELAARSSAERYRLQASVAWPKAEGRLELTRAPLARLGERAIKGDITGSVAVSGAWPDPAVEATLRLEDGRLNLDRLEVQLQASYAERRLSLGSLDLSFLNHRVLGAQGSLDLTDGEFRFRAPYRAEYFRKTLELTADLQGRIQTGDDGLSLHGLAGHTAAADLRLAGILVDGAPQPQWAMRLDAGDGRLRLAGGPGQAIQVEADRSGSFSLALGAGMPIQGVAQGQLRGGRIDSSCQVSSLDVRVLNTVMAGAAGIIRFNRGSAKGALRIAGAINDPDWSGTLEISDAELAFVPSPDPVGPINTELVFEEKTFYMPRTASYSGRTPVEAEGTFYLDHWAPEAIELFFYAEQRPGVHIRHTFGPVFTDGYATGAVRLRADGTTVLVQGKIVANSCRIALEREPGEGPERPPRVPLSVDLKIDTGRTVEFYWPAMNFPVLRAYARQGEELSLVLDGDSGEFALRGDVEIRGGEIFYFDRSFYLKQGSIAFEESVAELDPWIRAVAEVRERDINNEEITIYLEANNKLSQFSPRFYSVPSRPDVEILHMIGGTILNRFEQTDFGTAAVMLTSDIVSQFGILSPFERAVRDVLKLDLFSIRTQFLQNVLLGRIRGENPETSPFNPLDNTTLSLGKYLGTDLFLEALVRFQAVEDITSESSNVRTEGELNLEWETPFFLLEWTFAPMHPENLFLSDNSIGISWKFSY